MATTRRQFLIDSLTTAGAVMLGAGCTRATAKGTNRAGSGPGRKLGVALLGLGEYSAGQLAPALQQTRHCALRGVVTGSRHKIPLWQCKYGIEDRHVYSYDTLPQIANDDGIDVVYVVVPTALHAKYAVMAAEAGKHVWCEKPMAMTVEECQRIIDACRQNRVKLSIGYRMQHEPNTRTLMQYAETKPYGAIRGIRALAGYPGTPRGWRLQKEMGGGALYDMGVYSINGIRYASGQEPVRVLRAEQQSKRPELFEEVDETTEFELELPGGTVAYGRTSVGEDINQLRVDCRHGWYELSPMQRYTGVQGRTSDGKQLHASIANQQARQMDDDALAILQNRPVMVPGEEGLRDIHIVRAVLQAVETGGSEAI